jgi:hypothetical protein
MRRKRNGWNIVLAGFWNRMIFTPEWVGPRLFPGLEFETRVALLPVFPLIYRDVAAAMEVSMTRLVFRPRILNDDASLLRAEAMARTVLKALPETPVQAVGVNFSYEEGFPPDHLAAIFNDMDDVELNQQNWSIGERKLTRQLTRGGEVLNLTMNYHGEAVTFDFNFHSEAMNNAVPLQAVAEGRVVNLRNAALALLQEVYHLEPEEGDDDD